MASRTFKIVLNKNYGQFKLSKFAEIILDIMGHKNYLTLPRHHPDLVNVIETIGDSANNGTCIPVIYKIDVNIYCIIKNFRGKEKIITPSDVKWIDNPNYHSPIIFNTKIGGKYKLSNEAYNKYEELTGIKLDFPPPRHDINFIKVCSELAEKCNVEYLSELSYIYLNSFYYLIVEFNDGTETEVVPSNVIRIQFII